MFGDQHSFGEEDRALITLIPHTTRTYGSRFEVDVNVRFLKSGVFDVQNLMTNPRAKLIRRLGVLGEGNLYKIEGALSKWLGLYRENDNSNESP